jgi:hypothetical protein
LSIPYELSYKATDMAGEKCMTLDELIMKNKPNHKEKPLKMGMYSWV